MKKKEFDAHCSQLKPGDIFMIKRGGSWEMHIGWMDFKWYRCIFISFDGKEAIFDYADRPDSGIKVYLTFRKIKSREMLILWDRSDVFKKTYPTDLINDKVVSLWNPGELKHYK